MEAVLAADPLVYQRRSTHPGGQPRCRIHSLWPKRDGSLTELLRRTYTSISPGTPRIKVALL